METPTGPLPPKKEVLDNFLRNGSARIFIDPRRAGAMVPQWFAKRPELVLRVGYTLSPPIPDLVVSDEAVSCTLSFNRSPFWCKMPWSVVFAIVSDVNNRGVVWPEDVPVELRTPGDLRAAGPKAVASREDRTAKERPTSPREVTTTAAERPSPPKNIRRPRPAATTDKSAAPRPKRELPPYLRVVK